MGKTFQALCAKTIRGRARVGVAVSSREIPAGGGSTNPAASRPCSTTRPPILRRERPSSAIDAPNPGPGVMPRKGRHDEAHCAVTGVCDLVPAGTDEVTGPSAMAIPTAVSTSSAASPVIMIEPESRASGRSMESRSVMAGKPRIEDSSAMVPESESTQAASSWSWL